MSEHEHDERVEATLDTIRAGGQHLVMIARQRVGKLLAAIDEGDFRKALSVSGDITSALSPLSRAQDYIAVAGDSVLLLAIELKEGMVLADVGTITGIEVEGDCGVPRCPGHVKIKLGEHEVAYPGSTELYVDRASLPSAE